MNVRYATSLFLLVLSSSAFCSEKVQDQSKKSSDSAVTVSGASQKVEGGQASSDANKNTEKSSNTSIDDQNGSTTKNAQHPTTPPPATRRIMQFAHACMGNMCEGHHEVRALVPHVSPLRGSHMAFE